MQNLISRKDAARILGISIKTLDQARLNGTIHSVQKTLDLHYNKDSEASPGEKIRRRGICEIHTLSCLG